MTTGISRIGPCVLLLLAGFFAYRAISKNASSDANSAVATTSVTQPPASQEVFKRIQDVRVGDRAAPIKNPTGEFDDSLGLEVDQATWRKLELRAEKRDGTFCDIELLRPEWWIEERAAEAGGTIFISVPECGIDGNGEVVSISACPPIQPGTGPIVIGTFAHQSAQVINVSVEGLDEPIGVTTNHPIWSDTRQDFVPAGDLLPGERLHGINNNPRITGISPRGPPEPVYNVEVLGEHVYEVSSAGLLVHNSTSCLRGGLNPHPDGSVRLGQIPPSWATAPKGGVGFAQGTAADAVRNVGRIDHAGRHLSDFGVIAGNQGSKAFRESVRSNAIRILENPLKTFDHVIGSQQVKGFYGMIDGKQVVFFVAKGPRGKIGIGELVTSVVPSPQQIINWGL